MRRTTTASITAPLATARRSRLAGPALLRSLATLLLLAATLGSALSTLAAMPQGQDPPRATVRIVVHSCPDDTVATGFYQYGVACDSEMKRYGVPLGLSVDGGSSAFQYTQPETNAALEWTTRTGAVTVAEVVSDRVRESVSFCSLQPDGVVPPTMDGAEVPVTNGRMTIDLAKGDSLRCDWYRFPGGIAGGETDGDGDGDGENGRPVASASAQPSGASIQIRKWVCAPEEGQDVFGPADGPQATTIALRYENEDERPDDYTRFPVPFRDDPATDSRTLMAVCAMADRSFAFEATGDSGDVTLTTAVGGGTAEAGWDGIEPGPWVVTEDVPDGYGPPKVYCESQVAGRQNIRAEIDEFAVTDGAIEADLADDETLTCDWFNLLIAGGPADGAASPSSSPSGDAETSSLLISAWSCPTDGPSPLIAVADGLCVTPIDGLTFIAEGPDDYRSQTDTGDSRPGAVFFGGIEPGTYTVGSATTDTSPLMMCDGEIVLSVDGVATLEVPAGTDLACDWYVPQDDPAIGGSPDEGDAEGEAEGDGSDVDPSAEPESSTHNGNTQDPTNDLDDDGLLDTDETDVYLTDPANADTDADGVGDGDEVTFGYNPINPDSDSDGLTDGDEEYGYGTGPLDDDSDDDGYTDGYEVSVGSDPLDDQQIPAV